MISTVVPFRGGSFYVSTKDKRFNFGLDVDGNVDSLKFLTVGVVLTREELKDLSYQIGLLLLDSVGSESAK